MLLRKTQPPALLLDERFWQRLATSNHTRGRTGAQSCRCRDGNRVRPGCIFPPKQSGLWIVLRIWLLDFARQYPQAAQLDGLDISLEQVPNKEWLPSNISFHLYDVYDEPPAGLVEKYDIIHVRHLTLVIKQNDPTVVIHNLLKMLSMSCSLDCLKRVLPLVERYTMAIYVLKVNMFGYKQNQVVICNGGNLILEIE